MQNKINSCYDLSDRNIRTLIESKINNLPQGCDCTLYPKENKVEGLINGQYLSPAIINEAYDAALLDVTHTLVPLDVLAAFPIVNIYHHDEHTNLLFNVAPTGGDVFVETSLQLKNIDFSKTKSSKIFGRIVDGIQAAPDIQPNYFDSIMKNRFDFADGSTIVLFANDLYIAVNVQRPKDVSELVAKVLAALNPIRMNFKNYIEQ